MNPASAVEIPPRRDSLYAIVSDRVDLVAVIDMLDAEDHAEALDVLLQQLDKLDGVELAHKVENLCRFIRNVEGRDLAISDEVRRLQERHDVYVNKVARLKAYLKLCLEFAQLKKLQAGIFDVSIRGNGGNAPRDKARIEAETCDLLQVGPNESTTIPGVYVRITASLVIDDKELPDEYKLPRGTNLRIA